MHIVKILILFLPLPVCSRILTYTCCASFHLMSVRIIMNNTSQSCEDYMRLRVCKSSKSISTLLQGLNKCQLLLPCEAGIFLSFADNKTEAIEISGFFSPRLYNQKSKSGTSDSRCGFFLLTLQQLLGKKERIFIQ